MLSAASGEKAVESLMHTGSAVHLRVPSLIQLCLQTPGLPKKLPGLLKGYK